MGVMHWLLVAAVLSLVYIPTAIAIIHDRSRR